MTDYIFRYQLSSAPTATVDGSGLVAHDIWAIAQPEDNGDEWQPIRHKTVVVPAQELLDALAQPTQSARVTAYKDALVSNLTTSPTPITGWTIPQMEAFMDANDLAISTVAAVRDFIEVQLNKTYPVPFSL